MVRTFIFFFVHSFIRSFVRFFPVCRSNSMTQGHEGRLVGVPWGEQGRADGGTGDLVQTDCARSWKVAGKELTGL